MDPHDSSLPPHGNRTFDAFYYAHYCGKPYERNAEWMGFFGGIAQRIVTDVAPRRVLDAGCAMGFLVEALRDRGVDAFGMDLSSYAIERVYAPVRPFCRVGSITDDLGGDYDLIVSIEVVEHMPPHAAEAAIANICAHTADVIFSSSPTDYREATHVNVHPPEHWAELFARHGFFRDVDYDASYVVPWAARFRKRAEPVHRIAREYERRFWELQRDASEARSHATEVEHQLAAVEPQVTELAQTRVLLGKVEAERRSLEQRLAETADALRQARDTVFHMERSWFWKLRMAVVAIRKLLPGRGFRG